MFYCACLLCAEGGVNEVGMGPVVLFRRGEQLAWKLVMIFFCILMSCEGGLVGSAARVLIYTAWECGVMGNRLVTRYRIF